MHLQCGLVALAPYCSPITQPCCCRMDWASNSSENRGGGGGVNQCNSEGQEENGKAWTTAQEEEEEMCILILSIRMSQEKSKWLTLPASSTYFLKRNCHHYFLLLPAQVPGLNTINTTNSQNLFPVFFSVLKLIRWQSYDLSTQALSQLFQVSDAEAVLNPPHPLCRPASVLLPFSPARCLTRCHESTPLNSSF